MSEEEENMILAQRKRVVGEEKRIMEEMKRQNEVDIMLEILKRSHLPGAVGDGSQSITFDYEGKIMQIQKPNELTFPDTLTNPKVKMNQPIVLSNYIKDQMD